MNEIKIKCDAPHWIALKNLVKIQGKLKKLSSENFNKLFKSITENGFCEPFVVWKDKENKLNLISGNQRLTVLLEAERMEWKVPEKFPAVQVQAENLKEAKKILLSLASTFGKTDKEDFDIFLKENEFAEEEIAPIVNFPDFQIEVLEKDGNEKTEPIYTMENTGELITLKIPFFPEDYSEASGLLDKAFLKTKEEGKSESLSDTFILVFKEWLKNNESK